MVYNLSFKILVSTFQLVHLSGLHEYFDCVLHVSFPNFLVLSIIEHLHFCVFQARGLKKHLKRLNAPKHWMLDKLGGAFVSDKFFTAYTHCLAVLDPWI